MVGHNLGQATGSERDIRLLLVMVPKQNQRFFGVGPFERLDDLAESLKIQVHD